MSKQIQIPDIGSDEVTVTEVMVKAGDTITADQSIINVEGDKASMEVPAPEAGVVKEVSSSTAIKLYCCIRVNLLQKVRLEKW